MDSMKLKSALLELLSDPEVKRAIRTIVGEQTLGRTVARGQNRSKSTGCSVNCSYSDSVGISEECVSSEQIMKTCSRKSSKSRPTSSSSRSFSSGRSSSKGWPVNSGRR